MAAVDAEYLTVQEAARLLAVSESAVRLALREGRLAFEPRYGRKLIRQADLAAYRARTQPDGHKRVGRPRKGKIMQDRTTEKVVTASGTVAGGALLGATLGGPVGSLVGAAVGAGVAVLASSDRYSRSEEADHAGRQGVDLPDRDADPQT